MRVQRVALPLAEPHTHTHTHTHTHAERVCGQRMASTLNAARTMDA